MPEAGTLPMAAASYIPGGWLGLIRPGTVVILDPATPAPLVGTVWELLAKSPDAAEVLQAVTGGFGAPLSAAPCFGIIGYTDSLRVFLRGDIDLTVQLPSGPVTLDGRNVTTWTERWLDAAEWFSVAMPTAAAGQPASPVSAADLPVVEGAVLLRSLRVSVTQPGGGLPGAPKGTVASLEASAETIAGLQETVTGFTETGTATGTGSYDHLWDRTVVRSIEDAAVRNDHEDDGGAAAGAEAAVPATAGEEAEGNESAGQDSGPEDSRPKDFGPGDSGPGEAGPPAVPAESRATARPQPSLQADPLPTGPVDSGLIDSVPWATGGDRAPEPRVPPSFIPVPAPGEAPEGDHDGQTVLKSGLTTSGAQQAGQGREPGHATAAGNGPLVLARVCPGGHANPPTSSQCSTCAAQLPDVAVQVPRPRLGRLRLSTGELLDLDESLVIGRQPSVSRVQGGIMPRLVQVASPGGDISRSHVEVRLEGWHVMLCDLKATNGTVLVREGQPPRRLAQNEMAIVLDGDIAELGDDVSLRFEEIL